MIDERMFELLRTQLALANEEKSKLMEQVINLTEEVHMLRSSQEESSSRLNDLQKAITKLTETVMSKNKRIEELERALTKSSSDLANAMIKIEDGRKKRFARTSEQRALLNNRNIDKRAEEKAMFNGTNDSLRECQDDNDDDENTKDKIANKEKKEKKISKSREKNRQHVDKTVYCKLSDYYRLPEGARFMKREGEMDLSYYKEIKYQPAQVIEYIYEVGRVQLADGSFVPTMETPHAVDKCPFSSTLLAQVLSWKYVYNLSVNNIRKRLSVLGAHFSKQTLNRYLHIGIHGLRDFLEETFRNEVKETSYLMIDETCALVALFKDGIKSFKKKYIWAFYAKIKRMVYYMYEKGSRARDVVTGFLDTFCGFISSDGYVGYSIFDDEKNYPNIIRCGCWTHARRKFIDALPSDRQAMDVINDIGDLFKIETILSVNEDDDETKKMIRQRDSNKVMQRLYCRLKSLSNDIVTMSNEMMKNAVNYTLNQWNNLRNYILNGQVQISNNLVEQRMKPIKLNLKVCQNIGSEPAAEDAAFIFSLTESCALNNITPETYLEKLLRCIHDKDVDKKTLLPCYYKQ